MHHECIHQCTINVLITASSMHRASCNTSSMHSLHQMHQFRSFSSSFHHQCIVSAFINASPMYSSVYSSLHHQGNPSMHHQCFVNTLSMPSPTNHQPIVSAFVNASSMHSSMHLVINIPSMHRSSLHQMHQFFLSFIKFIQISSFALLFVHSLLCCCHSFRLSSFLFKFTLPVQFIFQAFIPSFAVRSCIHLIYYYIISVPR